ncbi:hypothetical protein [Vibrio phage vB_VhaS-a]|nr:hypothetical protein [Vibrio phage vB_VhaS-a]
MAEQVVELVLRARNEANKAFNELEKTVKGVNEVIQQTVNQAGSSTVPRFFVNLLRAVNATEVGAGKLKKTLQDIKVFNFNQVTQGIKNLGRELKKAREESEEVLETFEEIANVGDQLATGSAIPTLIATAGATSYANFSRAVAEVNTLLDGTIEKQRDLETEVLAISSAYGIDSTEVAAGYYQAISSGATDAANAVDFLGVAARTSIGGVTDLSTAVGGIATIVNAFQLEASQAGDAANALFVAVRAGRTTIGELSTSIADAAPLAATLGVQFEELLSAVSALTTAGTPTSQAITQIRSAMDALISQRSINVIFQELGFESSAAAIRAEGLAFALNVVRDAAGGSESALIELLGTQEAMGAVLSLTGNQAETFSQIMQDMAEDTNAVNRAFGAMDQVFGRELQRTIVAISNLFTNLGEALAPTASVLLSIVRELANGLSTLLDTFPTLSAVVVGTIAVITLLATTIGLTLSIVGRLGAGFVVLSNLLRGAAVAFGIVNVTAQGLIVTLGRVALALGAITGAFAVGYLIGEFVQWGIQIVRTRQQTSEARAELERLREAFPDASDMELGAIENYNDLTREQIDLIREQQRQRLMINNAEIAALTAAGDLTAEQWAQVNALRAQNKVIVSNDNLLRESLAARNTDFQKYSNEQLEAERKRINEAIDGNRRLAAQALIASNPDAVQALNQEYENYLTILDRVLAQLEANGVAANQVVDDLGLLARGYANSAEAARDFRNAVEAGLEADFNAAIAQIDLIQAGLSSAYDRGALGAEEFLIANRELAADRLAIERAYEQDLREQFERERAVREENIRRFSTSEKQRQKDLRDLQRETEQYNIQSYKREADAAIAARQKAYNEYQRYADRVKELEDSIAATQRDKENAVRDLRRQGYTELESYQDREREIAELNGRIQQAIDARNFALAEEYARRQISLAGQLSSEVQENGNVVITEQDAIRRAIAGTEQGYDNLAAAQQAQADEAQAQAELQLALYQSLDNTLKGIQRTLVALATGSELVIDIDENTDDVNEAIENYKQILADGATFSINPDVDQTAKEQTNQELAATQQNAEDQYGSLRIATYADTGEFEQEVFTITNDQGYLASVTVTAEDGQYYAKVNELTSEGFIVEGKPTLVRGDLEQFYADFENRIRSNPPKAQVTVDANDSQENIDQTVDTLEAPNIETEVEANLDNAREELEAFSDYANNLETASLHTIEVDNSAVRAANQANSRNTSSTHTIYVRQVEQRASGGLMGSFPRKARYISGAGTTTSDSIPAMLSRNEYVHRATAVKKYGLGFMNAINFGKLDPRLIAQLMRGGVPMFNTGGAVGVANNFANQGASQSAGLYQVNLTLPSGNVSQLQGSRDQITTLIDELREDKRK